MRHGVRAVALGLAVGCAAGTAHAAAYTFQILRVPGSSYTTAESINNKGQVAGAYGLPGAPFSGTNFNEISVRGFVYTDGSFATIQSPYGLPNTTDVFGINDLGQVTGFYAGSVGGLRHHYAFVDTAGSFAVTSGSEAYQAVYGINDSEQIAGLLQGSPAARTFVDAAGNTVNFSIVDPYETNGNINNLGQTSGQVIGLQYPGAVLTTPLGLNDIGQVVGIYSDAHDGGGSFLEQDGAFTRIDPPPGAELVQAYDINDAGQITGDIYGPNGVTAFIATPVAVPEPASVTLLGLGLAALRLAKRTRRSPAPA